MTLTNSGWRAGAADLAAALGLDRVVFVNDFAALSRALPGLGAADLHAIGGGEAVPDAPKVVVGPGTGLGVGALLRIDGRWLPVPSEGGHADFAAADQAERALADRIRAAHGHVSVERMVSGPGLARLHAMLAADRGAAGPALAPAEIVAAALAGSDPAAVDAVTRFARFLCRFAGDAALYFAARGGVYLGGGIPPRILAFLDRPEMRRAFEEKGRLSGLLAAMPLAVITAPDAGLRGAAAFLIDGLGRP